MERLCVYSSPGNKGRSFRELCVVHSVLCDSCLAFPYRSHSREHLGCLVAAPLWRCGPAAPNETFTDTLTTQPGNSAASAAAAPRAAEPGVWRQQIKGDNRHANGRPNGQPNGQPNGRPGERDAARPEPRGALRQPRSLLALPPPRVTATPPPASSANERAGLPRGGGAEGGRGGGAANGRRRAGPRGEAAAAAAPPPAAGAAGAPREGSWAAGAARAPAPRR